MKCGGRHGMPNITLFCIVANSFHITLEFITGAKPRLLAHFVLPRAGTLTSSYQYELLQRCWLCMHVESV